MRKKSVDHSFREEIFKYAGKTYGTAPEYLWRSYPNYAVLRHSEGTSKNKWYAVLMEVSRSSLGIANDEEDYSDDYVDIIDVKIDPFMASILRSQPGYLPGYHMNKKYWLTILLDGTVPLDTILNLLDQSFDMTESKSKSGGKKPVRTGPKDWLIPANPKYYDVVGAFEQSKIIDWKQSSDVRVGDTIYMYVAAPYSAILYKCKALEVNIPYTGTNEHINIKKLMRIELLNQYDPQFMTFDRLKKDFGVYAVRGPRSVPHSLKCELEL